jgi:hypothetical protein
VLAATAAVVAAATGASAARSTPSVLTVCRLAKVVVSAPLPVQVLLLPTRVTPPAR